MCVDRVCTGSKGTAAAPKAAKQAAAKQAAPAAAADSDAEAPGTPPPSSTAAGEPPLKKAKKLKAAAGAFNFWILEMLCPWQAGWQSFGFVTRLWHNSSLRLCPACTADTQAAAAVLHSATAVARAAAAKDAAAHGFEVVPRRGAAVSSGDSDLQAAKVKTNLIGASDCDSFVSKRTQKT